MAAAADNVDRTSKQLDNTPVSCVSDETSCSDVAAIHNYGLLEYDQLALCNIQKRKVFDQLKTRYDILKRSLNDGCSSQHQLVSVYLMLAVCADQLKRDEDEEDEDETTEYFLNKVLENEPNNLNALSDLHNISMKHYDTKSAGKCKETFLESVNDPVLQAKSYAEKAYAVAHDVHTCTRSYDRYRKSNELYEKALCMQTDLVKSGNDGISVEDIAAWRFDMGENYRRIYNIMMTTEKPSRERIDVFGKAAELYFHALNSNSSLLKGEVWSSIGTLFCKKPKMKGTGQKYPPFIATCRELQCFYNAPPLECFRKALEQDENGWPSLKIKAQYGWQCHQFNDTTEGLRILTEVIDSDPDNPKNWFAYSCRSKIHRIAYKKMLEDKAKGHHTPDFDKSLLQKALTDSLKCVKMNKSALEYANLAEIHHLLAIDSQHQVEEEGLIKKALKLFAKAEACQDGVFRPDIHQRRALCLRDNGDYRQAVEQFKRAIECENNSKYVNNFFYLMETFFQLYNLPKDMSLLNEMAYWFKKCIDQYTSVNIQKFKEKNGTELLALGEHLLRRNDLMYAKRCFSVLKNCSHETVKEEAKKLLAKTQKLIKEAKDMSAASVVDEPCRKEDSCNTLGSKCEEPRESVCTTKQPGNREDGDKIHAAAATTNKNELCVQLPGDGEDTIGATADIGVSTDAGCVTTSLQLSDNGKNTLNTTSDSDVSLLQFSADATFDATLDSGILSLQLSDDDKNTFNTTADSDVSSQPSFTDDNNTVDETLDSGISSLQPSNDGQDTLSLSFRINRYKNSLTVVHPDGAESQEPYSRKSLEVHLHRTISKFDETVMRKPEVTIEHARNSRGKKYDFFVVHCPEDEDWVLYVMLPKLEEELKFKGCVACRDFIAGKQKLKNFTEAIKSSARVIFILSEDFVNDAFCERLLNQASCTKGVNIIPFSMDKYDEESSVGEILVGYEKVHYCKYLDWNQVERSLLAGMQ